jgi:hypothetical protein
MGSNRVGVSLPSREEIQFSKRRVFWLFTIPNDDCIVVAYSEEST